MWRQRSESEPYAELGCLVGRKSHPKRAAGTRATWALGQTLLPDKPNDRTGHSTFGTYQTALTLALLRLLLPAPPTPRLRGHVSKFLRGGRHARHTHLVRHAALSGTVTLRGTLRGGGGPAGHPPPAARRCLASERRRQPPAPSRRHHAPPASTHPPAGGRRMRAAAAAGQSGAGSDGRRGAARRARRPRAGGAEEGDRAGQRLCHHHR